MRSGLKFIIFNIILTLACSLSGFLLFSFVAWIGVFFPWFYDWFWYLMQYVVLPTYHYFFCCFFYIGPFWHLYHVVLRYASIIAQAKRERDYKQELFWRKQLKLRTWHFFYIWVWSFFELNGIVNYTEITMALQI